MSRTATLSRDEAHDKARAESYLAETRRILRQLAAERKRTERRRLSPSSLSAEVRAILQGA